MAGLLTLADLGQASGLSGKRRVELERGLAGKPAAPGGGRKRTAAESDDGAISAPVSSAVEKRAARQVAYDEAKVNVDTWDVAVAAEKSCDTLRFGMRRKAVASAGELGSKFEPRTALEKDIAALLAQGGAQSERAVLKREKADLGDAGAATQHQVEQRYAELAKTRSVLFYAEQKAKYHAKIKSRAYAATKKKRTKKKLENAKESAADADPQLRAKMDADRAFDRVKERAALKHSTHSAWARGSNKREASRKDVNTKAKARDQLELGKELRKKQLLEESDEGESDDAAADDRATSSRALMAASLLAIQQDVANPSDAPDKGLFSMKFMQKAAAKQRERARDDAAALLRELEEEEADSDDDEALHAIAKLSGVLDEAADVEGEVVSAVALQPGSLKLAKRAAVAAPLISPPTGNWVGAEAFAKDAFAPAKEVSKEASSTPLYDDDDGHYAPSKKAPAEAPDEADETDAWLQTAVRAQKRGRKHISAQTLAKDDDAGDDVEEAVEDGEDAPARPLASLSQRELVDVAFAADDEVEEEFAATKTLVESLADTRAAKKKALEDEVVPGWGSWTGEGALPPPPTKRKKFEDAPVKAKVAVVQNASKLQHVILNPKRVRKASDLKVAQVPYPFTSRAQYERYMAKPVGTEWNTAGATRKLVQPSATVRPGAAIDPIQKKRLVNKASSKKL
ncbi:small-subunit processome [Pelagophyceae sp. CCMP2097]|nr:small-subunit processome [Pelagophyceae sp. CCMP2097]